MNGTISAGSATRVAENATRIPDSPAMPPAT